MTDHSGGTDGKESAMDEHTDHDKELRIGLVLYGGVSLAIYIYGVVYEFLRLLRSYPSADSQGEGFRPESRAYRRLLELAHTRPVIDIISGSSAGGINGICLGVALATQGDLKPLETLWVKKGDLLELIDRKSSKPRSLLDSEHYVYLLEEALRSISATASPSAGPAPLLDVFVTATDLDGVTQTFGPPLTTQEIEERQYGTVFHLKVRPDRYALRDDTPGSDRQTVFDRLGLEEHLSR
ncbi:hypothetical protein FJZ36_18620, partial [Candidatus Poribacteria bacterium]|nr:hypothetical protein [Candidatus Poribacteria bacterium]